jgi:hypothetical protein
MTNKEFRVRSGPLAVERLYIIGAEEVRIHNEQGGTISAVQYADIDTVLFSAKSVGGIPFVRLDLAQRGKPVFRIENDRWRGEQLPGSGCASTSALFIALIDSVAADRPRLEVKLGEGDFWTLMWFLLGLAILVLSLGLPVAALMTRVSGDRFFQIVPVMAILAIFGLVLMFNNRPWVKRSRIPIREFREFISRYEL